MRNAEGRSGAGLNGVSSKRARRVAGDTATTVAADAVATLDCAAFGSPTPAPVAGEQAVTSTHSTELLLSMGSLHAREAARPAHPDDAQQRGGSGSMRYAEQRGTCLPAEGSSAPGASAVRAPQAAAGVAAGSLPANGTEQGVPGRAGASGQAGTSGQTDMSGQAGTAGQTSASGQAAPRGRTVPGAAAKRMRSAARPGHASDAATSTAAATAAGARLRQATLTPFFRSVPKPCGGGDGDAGPEPKLQPQSQSHTPADYSQPGPSEDAGPSTVRVPQQAPAAVAGTNDAGGARDGGLSHARAGAGARGGGKEGGVRTHACERDRSKPRPNALAAVCEAGGAAQPPRAKLYFATTCLDAAGQVRVLR